MDHALDFPIREEGYFLKGNRINLTAVEEDITHGLSLRAGYRTADDPSTGVLYVWDPEVSYWRPARPILVARLRKVMAERWSENGEATAIGYILRGAPAMVPPDTGLVAFRNFVVSDEDPTDWSIRTADVDPSGHWQVQNTGDWTAVIPHDIYVPDQWGDGVDFEALMRAGTQKTSAFLGQVLPADAEEFAWEMIGNFLTTRRIDRKAIMLRGEGMNGKSRLLALIENLLGPDNVAHLPLQAINKTSSPELEGLRDKLANIVDDMGTAVGRDISNFKTAVTGGKISVNPKYQRPYEFEPRAKFAFAVNRLPHSPDTSAAWGSRWIIVPFDVQIPKEMQRPAEDIDAELLSEANWICTRAMHAAARLIARGSFDVPPSFDVAEDEFEEASNPVLGWIRDGGANAATDAKVRGTDLFGAFQRSEHGSAYRTMSARAFYEHLRGVPGVDARVSTGHAVWVFGLALPADAALSIWETRDQI